MIGNQNAVGIDTFSTSRTQEIIMFFNELFNMVNEKISPRMKPEGERCFGNTVKNRRDGFCRHNPLMTPLPPSVIRMEWTV
jgi:hypothetical protein